MAKSASAEIGRKRFYHHIPPNAAPCGCGARIDPDCIYSLLSVTTILDALPKPWLGAWAAKVAAQYAVDIMTNLLSVSAHEGPEAAAAELQRLVAGDLEKEIKGAPWRKRDAAADRGTATHEAAELGTSAEDVPDDVKGKVLAWHMWLDDYQPDIEYQEATVYAPFHGYAGTADLFAGLTRVARPLEGRWLIDIKTGNLSWTHRLQQAAYRYGTFIGDANGNRVSDVPAVDHVGILALRDDGYEFVEVRAGEEEHEAFLLTARFARMVDDLKQIKDVIVGGRTA